MKTEYTDGQRIYEVKKEIGKGAQGVVYETFDEDIAVKLILENEKKINDKNKIKLIQRDIKKIIYKPFPKDISLAKPLAVLKDEAGYVMYLLKNMKPLNTLFPQKLPKNEEISIPDFLDEYAKTDKMGAEYIAYYLKSGSLRLRLKVLSRLALTLHRLYSRGMIYCDISYNNIFYNENGVYLIDADNIDYADNINKNIYTPEFEVPEILKGEKNSIYSDIYQYAILAYYLLTMNHPFDGALLENEWDNEEKDISEIPWIEDSGDSSNESQKVSLRGDLTITKELDFLFHKTFEEGKINKYKRPSLILWIEAFEKAFCQTLKCPECKMSYYDELHVACPYCHGKKPKRVEVVSFYKENSIKRWRFVKEIESSVVIGSYLFESLDILNIDKEFLSIIKKDDLYKFIFKKTGKIYLNNRLISSVYTIPEEELEKGIELIVKKEIPLLVTIKVYQ